MAPLEAAKNQPDISRPVELEASRGYGTQAGWNCCNPMELCSAILGQGVPEFIEVLPAGDFDLHLAGETYQLVFILTVRLKPVASRS
jgi:hypothetical protein